MKKLLFVIMACVLCIGLVGGAFAYFSDEETSTGNTFTAGTLDLALTQTPVAPILLTNMAPGDDEDITWELENLGSINGVLSFTFSYGEADGTQPAEYPTNLSADDFAKLLIITVAEINDGDVLGDWITAYGAEDGDATNLSIYDLANSTITGPLDAGEIVTVDVTIQLDPDADNDAQADGIVMDVTVGLDQ